MHVLSVPASAVCLEEVLDKLCTKTSMRKKHQLELVEHYTGILRANGKIDVAPLLVRQNSKGYLHLMNQNNSRVAYLLASYMLGKNILVVSRKQLRPIGTARTVYNGRCSCLDGPRVLQSSGGNLPENWKLKCWLPGLVTSKPSKQLSVPATV
jgi:hypothetical protein